MKLKVMLAAAIAALGIAVASADVMGSTSTVTPGTWCSDFDAAKTYAEANKTPMLVFWANTGCHYCEMLETACKRDDFKTWAANKKMVMVFRMADLTVKSWVKSLGPNKLKAFPFMAVYWPKADGTVEAYNFEGRSGSETMLLYGANKKTDLQQQLMDVVDNLTDGWESEGGDTPVTPTTYTVTFVVDSAKGTASGNLTQTVASGSAATAPTVTAKSGWTFTGWDKTFGAITADTTVTAKFTANTPAAPTTYTVTFVVDGTKGTATGDLTQTVEAGTAATAPTVTALDGWTFTGWNKSYGKVTADLTVTAQFAAVVEREEIVAATVFKKAQSFSAVAYGYGDLAGQATVSISKLNRKGQVKVSIRIAPFAGTAATKSVYVTPNEYGDLEGTLGFKSSMGGDMDFALTYDDGEFSLEASNDNYDLERGTVVLGGYLTSSEMTFSVEMDEEPEGPTEDWSCVVDAPSLADVTVTKGKTLKCGSTPSIKYVGNSTDGYELSGTDDENKTNVNALKLSYKYKTGAFTGSFKVWFSNDGADSLYNENSGKWKKPSLKSYTAKVSGVVANGTGYGAVTLKVGKVTYTGTCTLSE